MIQILLPLFRTANVTDKAPRRHAVLSESPTLTRRQLNWLLAHKRNILTHREIELFERGRCTANSALGLMSHLPDNLRTA